MWTGAWTPILPQALSDQRLADFMSLQVCLANLRSPAKTQDAWLWCQFSFSARALYRLLRRQAPLEIVSLIRHCRVVWKKRLPLKIRLFGWLLLRRPLMTRAMHRRLFPGAVMSCPLCDGEEEDCSHLLFTCLMVRKHGGRRRRGCSSRRVFRRGFLELPQRQLIQIGDGLEASIRHVMGDLAPQE